MTFSDRVLDLQVWCRKHRIPYVHGCLWDRECRSYGAPPRVSLHWLKTMYVVELPVPFKGFVFPEGSDRAEMAWQWNRPGLWKHRRVER